MTAPLRIIGLILLLFVATRPLQAGSMASTVTLEAEVQPLNLSAGFSVMVDGGHLTPTGTVTVKEGAVTLGTSSIAFTPGDWGIPYTFNAPGPHVLVAYYSGDSNFASAQSVPTTVLVVATSVVLTPTGPIGTGLVLGIQASVTGAGLCQGTLSLTESGKVLTSALLSAGSITTIFDTSSNPLIPTGPHTLVASFTTSGTHCGSATSPPLAIYTGVPTSSTQITSITPNPSLFGQIPKAVVKVTAAVGANNLGGTVLFSLLGNTTGLGSGTLDTSGMLSIGLPSLPVGSWPIVASYQGSEPRKRALRSQSL